MTASIYEAAGGQDAFVDLARAWHRRCLADPVVSHAFSHPDQRPDDEHIERLASYWAEALGGPAAYTSAFGNQYLVLRLHSGNGEHAVMDRRAESCFDGAIADVGLSDDERLRETLRAYFRWANVAMSSHPDPSDDIPAGHDVPKWTWDGPAGQLS